MRSIQFADSIVILNIRYVLASAFNMEARRVWPWHVTVRFLLATMAMIPVLRDSQSFPLAAHAATVAGTRMDRSSRFADLDGAQLGLSGMYKRSTLEAAQDTFERKWRNDREEMLSGVSDQKVERAVQQHMRGLTTTNGPSQQLNATTSREELEALTAFKEGVTNDSLHALSSWNSTDSDACNWRGVTCTPFSKRIVALELGSLQLWGSISPVLGSLRYLQNLNLSDNYFTGPIPTALLNCSQLSYLSLGNNNLSGHVPSQLGDLRNLQSLDLGSNPSLAGVFPASLGNCSLLKVLLLNYTNVAGEIPPSIGQLAHLEILDIYGTLLSGAVPTSLGNCSSLVSVNMGNDDVLNPKLILVGELPPELGQLVRLTRLSVSGSNIQGHIPGWIANLTRLTDLELSYNYFTGQIPAFLGQLPLESVVFGGNNLTGALPVAITNCSNLTFLTMEGNLHLSGTIPPELGLLTKLGTLALSLNNFSGIIPSALSNLSALTVLELGENPLIEPQVIPSWIPSLVNLTILYLADLNLVGEIPPDIGKLSQVQYLYLWGQNLSGPIPPSIGNCTSLIILELAVNQLTGELPSELWWLSQLQTLLLGQNLLTGALSASIGNLSEMQTFQCYTNFFKGSVPSQLGSLENLWSLDLSENSFDGDIPQTLGNASALLALFLGENQLGGSIPDSLGNLSALTELDVSANRLQGSIPVELMRYTALESMDLSHNSLTGSIPLEIGGLASLQGLYLHHNELSGVIPYSLASCSNLLYVDLSYNAFYGAIPGEVIANVSAGLNSFNVSHNLLSGSLPSELETLAVVQYLDFSVNNISGSIPPGLGDCKSLQSLDLSINNLSGAIPQALVKLQYLEFLNVSYNHLQGPIPDGGIFAGNVTAASFLGDSGLCGNIVRKDCPSLAPPGVRCKGFHCRSVRIAVACIAAGVALFATGVLVWLLRFHDGKLDDAYGGDLALVIFSTGLNLSAQDILKIIERRENIVGVGASSTVYKGVLKGGRSIAVKVFNIRSHDTGDDDGHKQAASDLWREAQTLSKLRHRNILKVLGLLSTRDIKALILEFMPNASLHEQLYHQSSDGPEVCKLTCNARLDIALGVAQGILYLHSSFHEPVIHRDLKPGNIFLDADLEPKLGDFGISRFANPDRDGGETTASSLCGTVGYIAPEYGTTTRVSTKGDVYSYGVILLELLTRKHPILPEQSVSGDDKHLVDWVLESFQEAPLAVLDPMLIKDCIGSDIKRDQMKLLMQVGLLCTQDEPQNRPQMSDVLAMVMQIKERGLDPVSRPTLEELADDVTGWSSRAHAAAGNVPLTSKSFVFHEPADHREER